MGRLEQILTYQSNLVPRKVMPKMFFQSTRLSIPFVVATMFNTLTWAFRSINRMCSGMLPSGGVMGGVVGGVDA